MINGIEQLCKFAFNFSNIDTLFIDSKLSIELDYGLVRIPELLEPYFLASIDKLNLNESDSEYSVLFHTNSYRLNFISAKVYDDKNYLGSIVVGPFLLEEPTIFMIEAVMTENKMAISLKNILKQYYLSLPLINSQKVNMTTEFLSYIVTTFNPYTFNTQKIKSIKYDFQTEYSVSSEIIKENTEHAMETLEKIYSIENALLHAVETGNLEQYKHILSENNSLISKVPDRVPNDPLRSMKSYCITLNTLLRKASEKGGLHPFYINSLTVKYAVQIEKCSTFQQLSDLVNLMQIEYCEAVRKFSLKKYSYNVRKAIEFIRFNLNQKLTLDSISVSIPLSSYELSRQFKKETGENIIEYINKIRINEAVFILDNENISITDVALMIGYNDVDYFSKVFKKYKGISPSEYRKK
jgi:two-component system, response regulator YesN